MEEIDYLRFKCKILEFNNQEIQLNQVYEKLKISKIKLLQDIGLDPNKNYNMDDKTFEVKEIDGKNT